MQAIPGDGGRSSQPPVLEEGLKGGRQRGKKALVGVGVGVAVEVRGRGSGRLRLAVLPDATADSLAAFVTTTTAPGAIVHTDGWPSYKRLAKLTTSTARCLSAGPRPASNCCRARTAPSPT